MNRALYAVGVGVLVTGWAGLGCGPTQADPVLVRDSAGVTITESMEPKWSGGDSWALGPVPTLDLATAGEGSAYEFFQVADATRRADGTIAVADRGSAEVRVFAEDGRFVGRAGREGEGPGEFQRLSMVSPGAGDSLLAYDYWPGRLTVLDPELAVGRIATKPASVVRLQEIAPLNDSLVAAVLPVFTAMEDVLGLMRIPNVIVRMSMDLAVVDTVAAVPGYETFVFETGDARPVLGRRTFVRTYDERVYVGTGDGLEYRVYSGDGTLEEIVRVPGFDLSLSQSVLEQERASRLPDNMPQRFRTIEERIPNPAERPGYADLIVDGMGYVWAQWYPTRAESEDPLEWQVFSPTGEWLGGVTFPPRFTVFEIGPDYVLGDWRDELGVSHVQLLELGRSSRK